VATLTARSRRDPVAWLVREVAVAGYVASQGGPVVAPAEDAGPHWQDGFAISLWEYVSALDLVPGPADVGSALARLHQIARGCTADLGGLNAATDQITDGLAMLEREADLDVATLVALREAHTAALSEMRAADGEPVVLHGDAHHGNLLAAPGRGWLWIDLEETGRGPAAWDLATMVSHYTDHAGRTALAAYAAEAGTTVPALAPFRRVRDLEAAVWSLCMARLYPARYREVAHHLLASVLPR
jgi:Ser/Thr protein kinase RdoA (MazF antagonist)